MYGVPPLFKPITIDDLPYPYVFQTNRQMLDFANGGIRPAPNKGVEIYMFFDIIQSFVTFCFCASVMFKKGRVKDTRILTLRRTPHGTFIVPNAVWWMLSLIAVDLLSWSGFCCWILYIQKTNRPFAEWLWYIPAPWMPLILGAFYSSYSFVVTCSPRSPISNLAQQTKRRNDTNKPSWIHLPLPQSAVVNNAFMISVGVVMLGWNVAITALNSRERAQSHRLEANFYQNVLIQPHTQDWLDATPTPEDLQQLHLAWIHIANMYRYCCLALASYMALIVIIALMLILYAVPNQYYLMDHLVRIYPGHSFVQPEKRNLITITRALYQIGLPRKLKGTSYSAFQKTWVMVMIGHSQTLLILAGLFTFSVPTVYLFFAPWKNVLTGKTPNKEVAFIVAFCITAVLITAAWVMGISTVLTFDEIFATVSGNGKLQAETTANDRGARDLALPETRNRRPFIFPGIRVQPPTPSATLTAPPPSPDRMGGIRSSLHTKASFSPSSADSFADKMDAVSDQQHTVNFGTNQMIVVTETEVRVDHDDDVEAQAAETIRSSAPFSFPGRTRSRTSKLEQ